MSPESARRRFSEQGAEKLLWKEGYRRANAELKNSMSPESALRRFSEQGAEKLLWKKGYRRANAELKTA